MEVINLGNFGQRRPSPFEGVPNALQEGLRTGAEQGKNIAEIKNMQAQRAYQQQELKIRQAEINRQVDKDEFEKEQKMAEHGLVVADNLKMKLDTMDPTMKAITLQSPTIKAVTDGLKKTNPELFDDKGEFVGRSTEAIIKAQAQQHVNDSIQTIKTLSEKAKAQGGLSPDDMNAMQTAAFTTKLLHNSNMDDISSFMQKHYAAKSNPNQIAQDAQNQPWYQKVANMFKGGQQSAQNPMATALAPVVPAPTSAVPMPTQSPVPAQGGGSNPNDPAGIGV